MKKRYTKKETSFKVALQCVLILLLCFVFILIYMVFLSNNIISVPEDDINVAMLPRSSISVEEVRYPKPEERQEISADDVTTPSDALGDIDDIQLDIRTIEIDADNYDGSAEFLWMSDLHMIQDDSATGRYADILGHEYNSAAIMKAAVKYANDNSLPMILGADIVDYASNNNYNTYSRIMGTCKQTVVYIRADHDIATDLNNPDNFSSSDAASKANSLKGVVSGSHSVIDINGLNLVCLNMSTNKSGENAVSIGQMSSQPCVIITHVPFPIGDTTQYIQNNPLAHDLGVSRTSAYNWDYAGSQWSLGSNDRLSSIYETAINNDNVSAVFCGHTHLKTEHITSSDGLQQVLLSPAFAGIVYHIKIK